MGWEALPWYTLTDDFDSDFDVGEWHGTNAFLRDDDDRIFRTYFVDGRGDEALGGDLELPRHHRAWSPGDLGGLSRGLPADAGQSVVAPPRRVRRAIVIAHVGGVPVEELLPSLTGAGASLLLARGWLTLHVRRQRRAGR